MFRRIKLKWIIMLVLIALGSVANLVIAMEISKENSDIKPLEYGTGWLETFVKKSNGEEVGSNSHFVPGVASGVDHYYDPSTWGDYIGGADLACFTPGCPCAISGSCQVDALNDMASGNVRPCDWYGYDTCDYSGICSNGCGVVYGTVTASCSTIYGCYIDVEWRAMCYSSGI